MATNSSLQILDPQVTSYDEIRRNIPVALVLSTLAGLSTGLGGLIMTLHTDLTYKKLGLWQAAAAGFMICVSVEDLLPEVLKELPLATAIVWFLFGALCLVALKQLIPEPDLSSLCNVKDMEMRHVLWSGLVTAIGIAAHNFPEGVAVCVASLKGLRLGLPLAFVIGLHNIPEGMAVALPVYFATQDKAFALKVATISGLAEPLGVIAVLLLAGNGLDKVIVASMMSAVSGVMVMLSLLELIPQALKHAGTKEAALATTLGFIGMLLILWFIQLIDVGV